MRRGIAVVAVAAVGAACTGAPLPPVDGSRAALPTCERLPGRGVEGFALHRSKEVQYRDHIGVRSEYSDRRGRRLFYLMGILGEIGESSEEIIPVTLVDGTPATFFGQRDAWGVYWRDETPCQQTAVIGNGFARDEFILLLREADLLSGEETFRLSPFDVVEWVAVFRTANQPDALNADTEALLQAAPGHMIVAPVGCHEGLAAALAVPEGSYFSGVIAASKRELRGVLDAARTHPRFREPPLLSGRFGALCGF